MSDCFAAEFVAMDGFVENGNPDPGAARVTGVVLGGAGRPGVRFDTIMQARGGLFVLIDDGFAQSMGQMKRKRN